MREACSAMMARKRSRAPRVVLGGALQGLDEAAQRGERGAQLVARIGDEIRPHLVDALDLGQVAQEHENVAGAIAPAAERRHRRGHAAADGNPLGIGDGDGAAALQGGADRVEKFGRADHRGDVAALAQRGKEPARRRVAVEHLARAIEQDGGVGQRLGHDLHLRGGRARGAQGMAAHHRTPPRAHGGEGARPRP